MEQPNGNLLEHQLKTGPKGELAKEGKETKASVPLYSFVLKIANNTPETVVLREATMTSGLKRGIIANKIPPRRSAPILKIVNDPEKPSSGIEGTALIGVGSDCLITVQMGMGIGIWGNSHLSATVSNPARYRITFPPKISGRNVEVCGIVEEIPLSVLPINVHTTAEACVLQPKESPEETLWVPRATPETLPSLGGARGMAEGAISIRDETLEHAEEAPEVILYKQTPQQLAQLRQRAA
ncbi:hypothetical protein PAPYR_2007 [Paratrimastix pyriformis]|uniref:Uncharacterized protein n=1 Tax=Paratrimastix pyriformis TaxID=342808 RepID=A0ABQ8URG8_9EUKA|nr:hypothetical protein PAPYR_2007 [Paratrimastix pyriformis]